MNPSISTLADANQAISRQKQTVEAIRGEVSRVLVGQERLLDRLLMALVCNGHILLEGVPGIAKTTAVRSLAIALGLDFHRISFTPDLLPSDVVGTLIYDPKNGTFTPKKGPVFANLLLADEINRAPAKVQSALLEAMQERRVTLGDETYSLPSPFLVLATQNPIEQEGTYPLPEAQVDRFMFKVKVEYPEKDAELKILRRMASSAPALQVNSVLKPTDVKRLRELTDSIFMDEKIESYIVDLVDASRHPEQYGLKEIQELIRYGASPRATIFLAMASKAQAFVEGRPYVTPQDVKSVAKDVLRHRIMVTYEAEAEEVSSEQIVQKLLDTVKVP